MKVLAPLLLQIIPVDTQGAQASITILVTFELLIVTLTFDIEDIKPEQDTGTALLETEKLILSTYAFQIDIVALYKNPSKALALTDLTREPNAYIIDSLTFVCDILTVFACESPTIPPDIAHQLAAQEYIVIFQIILIQTVNKFHVSAIMPPEYAEAGSGTVVIASLDLQQIYEDEIYAFYIVNFQHAAATKPISVVAVIIELLIVILDIDCYVAQRKQENPPKYQPVQFLLVQI
ncbi:Hypothetical_protein [Hexamita inflata]|uniref:Hypothetical_protein n=1 Tax=Hexamita inflata TaxID=28002 RepID=A0AA86P4B7_9EUKA|nr:Hypothetical protein HINF_LOCUS19191 [Hexamita inflata]